MKLKSSTFLIVRLAVIALVAVILPSCASIQDRWTAAEGVHERDPFSGLWAGTWTSSRRHDEGGCLRCVMTPVDINRYRADFEAHWKIFSTTYALLIDGHRSGNRFTFSGTHELPRIFGGVYHFSGTVTPTRFSAEYRSCYDDGHFEMRRPVEKRCLVEKCPVTNRCRVEKECLGKRECPVEKRCPLEKLCPAKWFAKFPWNR